MNKIKRYFLSIGYRWIAWLHYNVILTPKELKKLLDNHDKN